MPPRVQGVTPSQAALGETPGIKACGPSEVLGADGHLWMGPSGSGVFPGFPMFPHLAPSPAAVHLQSEPETAAFFNQETHLFI